MKKEYKKPLIKKFGEEKNLVPALIVGASLAVGYAAGKAVKSMMEEYAPTPIKRLERVEDIKLCTI